MTVNTAAGSRLRLRVVAVGTLLTEKGVPYMWRDSALPLALGSIAATAGAGIAVAMTPASSGAFWLTILWAAWIIAVIWALTRRIFSLPFAAVMAAMLLFVTLPATEAQLFQVTEIAGNDYQSGVARALEIAALAQCGMLAGAVAARTLWPAPAFRRISPVLAPRPLDRASRRSVAAGVLAIVALSFIGGASLFSFFAYTTAGGYGTFVSQASGKLAYLTAAEVVAGLALVLLPLRLRAVGRAHWLAPLAVAGLATLVLLGGGQRGRFFVPVFAAGLIWLKTSRRRIAPRRLAAAGAIALVILAAVIGVARGAAGSRDVTVSGVLAAPLGTGNNLFLPLAGLAAAVPGQEPYLHGASYSQILLFPIPRALWSGKPQGDITTLTAAFDPSHSGIAFPEFGEMYANFGLVGVVVGSLVLAALIELLSMRLARSASIRESVLVAVCEAVLLDVFTRGAIAPMLTAFGWFLVATALVCRRRSPVLATAPGSAPGPVPPQPALPAPPKRAVVPP
jgi:hypothetical protein